MSRSSHPFDAGTPIGHIHSMSIPDRVPQAPGLVFEARFLKRQVAVVLGLGVVITGAGLFISSLILNAPGGSVETPLLFITAFVVMIGIGMAAVAIRRLAAPQPALRMSAAGLLDRNIGPETIPWSAITEAYVTEYFGPHLMIRIDPEHPVAASPHRDQRVMAKANEVVKAPGFAVTIKGIDQSFDAIVAAIETFRPVDRQ